MWQEPHDVPIRNGGSIEPSARRVTALSELRVSSVSRLL